VIAAIHQPNFMPWLGYFYKIHACDVFVFLDNVQYSKNSVINRNKIKSPQGEMWLTIPVKIKKRFGQLIKDVEIDNGTDWRAKHIKTLEMNYARARFYDEVLHNLRTVYYANDWGNLCQFNSQLLMAVLSMLKLEARLVRASDLNVEGESSRLLINICKEVDADIYLSGFGGAKYQEEELFEEAGIKLKYYEFKHPVYPQLWQGFVPNMSIIDMLFNCGSESMDFILGNKQE